MGTDFRHSGAIKPHPRESPRQEDRSVRDRIVFVLYFLMLVASVLLWLPAINAPLRQDETGSYWRIAAGFWGIWPRGFISLEFPSYPYVLWASSRILGTSEIALRVPSVLAMFGAVYLVYRSVAGHVGRETAVIAAIIFCLNPVVAFAAIDVRPYAFALLATNAAIFVFVRLCKSNSIWLAALFGLLSAFIVYFHFLFATILPAFLLIFVGIRWRERKALFSQLGVALVVFAIAFLPVIPALLFMFRTAGSHVVPADLSSSRITLTTLAPGWIAPAFMCAAFAALILIALRIRPTQSIAIKVRQIAFWACIALVPFSILMIATFVASIDVVSAAYHRLAVASGVSACWAMVVGQLRFRSLRVLFCILFLVITTVADVNSVNFRRHGDSWRRSLEIVNQEASTDNAPIVICSNFIESNFAVMPSGPPETSFLFAPLSYYKISEPVIPMPEVLNAESDKVFSAFLNEAVHKHHRFFAVGHSYSSAELAWMQQRASESFSARSLGEFDGVTALEFVRKPVAGSPTHATSAGNVP